MLKFKNTFVSEDFLEAIAPDPTFNAGSLPVRVDGTVPGPCQLQAIAFMRSGAQIPLGITMKEAEAVLYQADLVSVQDGGYVPVYDMSDDERVRLMALYDEGFRYLARDENTGRLFAYREKPTKGLHDWLEHYGDAPARVKEGFDFVSSEDTEPLPIADALTWEAACDD